MKNIALLSIICLLFSCNQSNITSETIVSTKDELYKAIVDAKAGDNIIMSNGIWQDVQIRLVANGTKDNPITLKAETPGKVTIEGVSDLKLGGNYLIVSGLYFTNGYSPSDAVIAYSINDDTVANHSIVTNCVIKDFNKLQRNQQDLWVLLHGRHNQLDHCYIAGKSNRGPTVRVDLEGNRNIKNYHKITNNYFGPRPPKGGPSAETIQIGNSYTSMCPSYTIVENNYFDRCNGEVEIISSKTNFNEFRNNVFYKSEGSLVTRHGNYCTVDGNYFIGDETSENIGGVRLIGTGHIVTNNYFYKLKGRNFRSPLAVMNGIPKSPLNRYIQVTDVVVAYNSWINCVSPLQFGVGSNVNQKDVLPASEIRSDRPIRTIVANNLIYNTAGDKIPVVAHDELDGIRFESNVINNQGVAFDSLNGIVSKAFELNKSNELIWTPEEGFPNIDIFSGFEFDHINKDLFGASRTTTNNVGAIVAQSNMNPLSFDKSKYGPDWFAIDKEIKEAKTHEVDSYNSLVEALSAAQDGDIIALTSDNMVILSSLKIAKKLTIQGNNQANNISLMYQGAGDTPLFEMNPKGQLTLKNVNIMGDGSQYAFASLDKNMSSLYNLTVEDCKVENFNYILKAFKHSFSENINLKNSSFNNCENGIELSEETEDKGEYNAENIVIDNCQFNNISQNVIDYYRGGYDESTVGGTLSITNSTFTNSGAKEKNGTLLNTYGIINVNIADNTFIDNKVKLVAELWGAKNNTHSGNKIANSGKIAVEENLKLKLLY